MLPAPWDYTQKLQDNIRSVLHLRMYQLHILPARSEDERIYSGPTTPSTATSFMREPASFNSGL